MVRIRIRVRVDAREAPGAGRTAAITVCVCVQGEQEPRSARERGALLEIWGDMGRYGERGALPTSSLALLVKE